MASALTDAHHEWIKQVSGGAFDPVAKAKGSTTPKSDAPDQLEAHKAALQRLSAVWATTEQEIRQCVGELHQEIRDLYDGDEAASQADAAFQSHVDTLFDTFDGTLAKELASCAQCKTEADLTALKMQLRQTIKEHVAFVSTDPTIAVMEDNPLIEIDIIQACTSALDEMARIVA
jgi:hypothetical protein